LKDAVAEPFTKKKKKKKAGKTGRHHSEMAEVTHKKKTA